MLLGVYVVHSFATSAALPGRPVNAHSGTSPVCSPEPRKLWIVRTKARKIRERGRRRFEDKHNGYWSAMTVLTATGRKLKGGTAANSVLKLCITSFSSAGNALFGVALGVDKTDCDNLNSSLQQEVRLRLGFGLG